MNYSKMADNPESLYSYHTGETLRTLKHQFNMITKQNPNRLQSAYIHEEKVNQLFDTLEFELILWQTPYSPLNYNVADRDLQQTIALKAKKFLGLLPQSDFSASNLNNPSKKPKPSQPQKTRDAPPPAFSDSSTSTHPLSSDTYP